MHTVYTPHPKISQRTSGYAVERLFKLALLAFAVMFGGFAYASEPASIAKLPPGASAVLPLYIGAAPGSESWTWHEVTTASPWGGEGGRLVRDVVHPSLTVFKPQDTKRATRTAVIVAPGGGFLWLSIDSEGYDVARALAARGFTAIVLKYRLLHTPESGPQVSEQLKKMILADVLKYQKHQPPLSPASNPAIADGIAAVRYVRQHAAQLGVASDRIGMLGFSAGGVVTQGTVLHGGPESHLDFVGLIYGAFTGESHWPDDTPPVFLAVASNDPTGAEGGTLSAFKTLRAQHHSVELHVFDTGGHGFGLEKHGLTTDLWFKEFVAWLAANGLST